MRKSKIDENKSNLPNRMAENQHKTSKEKHNHIFIDQEMKITSKSNPLGFEPFSLIKSMMNSSKNQLMRNKQILFQPVTLSNSKYIKQPILTDNFLKRLPKTIKKQSVNDYTIFGKKSSINQRKSNQDGRVKQQTEANLPQKSLNKNSINKIKIMNPLSTEKQKETKRQISSSDRSKRQKKNQTKLKIYKLNLINFFDYDTHPKFCSHEDNNFKDDKFEPNYFKDNKKNYKNNQVKERETQINYQQQTQQNLSLSNFQQKRMSQSVVLNSYTNQYSKFTKLSQTIRPFTKYQSKNIREKLKQQKINQQFSKKIERNIQSSDRYCKKLSPFKIEAWEVNNQQD